MTRLALVAAVAAIAGCATVEVTSPPEQRDAAGAYGHCASPPIVLCDAGPPGEYECHTEPDAGDVRSQIPSNASYPIGCAINFPSPTPLKATGECTLIAQCVCVDPASKTSAWKCVQ
jgi:hypothetical protein